MSKNKLKSMPKFKSEDEEREFWATHDSTDYFDKSIQVNPSDQLSYLLLYNVYIGCLKDVKAAAATVERFEKNFQVTFTTTLKRIIKDYEHLNK